ncbi:MAG: FtsX-like permease family protein [Pseudomonadota bacterium]
MSTMRGSLAHLLRLALRDLWHERWLAFCAAAVLAATLAPLWTLWGLENGVIGTLIERQNRDPVMRRVLPESTGNHKFDAAWFRDVASWPGLAFVLPETRSIASQVDLFANDAPAPVRTDLLPTASGDPLLGNATPPAAGQVLLSARAAAQLRTARGGSVSIALERQREGETERGVLTVVVAGVLPVEQGDGTSALCQIALLEDIQAWRDGYTVESLGLSGNGPVQKTGVYPRFRAYATSIQDVGGLAARLEAAGISVYTRGAEIASTLGLQRNLRAVLAMVAAISAIGAAVALIAMQLSAVQRKRREYALLQLTGHGRSWLMALPCVNAAAVALLGALMAWVVYLAAAGAINAYFARHLHTGEAAVKLGASGFGLGVAAVLILSILPALLGGWKASNVEAAHVLRDI